MGSTEVVPQDTLHLNISFLKKDEAIGKKKKKTTSVSYGSSQGKCARPGVGRNLLHGTRSQEKQFLIEGQGRGRAGRSELKPCCSQDAKDVSLREAGCQLSGQWSRTGWG